MSEFGTFYSGIVNSNTHRLSHNVFGPHDENFHNLWNQLRDEHEQLLRKGYTGEGFLSTGQRLGGARIPPAEIKRRARAAAEKRRTLTTGSGQKLGGSVARPGKDIRQVIADAAQRRNIVTKGCASGTGQTKRLVEETSKNGFRTKAEEDDANERAIMQAYIDLIEEDEREQYGKDYVPPSAENPAGPRGSTVPPSSQPSSSRQPTARKSTELSKSRSSSISTSSASTISSAALTQPQEPASIDLTRDDDDPNDNATFSSNWTCEICTLQNPANYLCCGACECERPEPTSMQTKPAPPAPSASSSSLASKLAQKSAVKQIIELEKKRRPSRQQEAIGWLCNICGTFMENHWWTCAACGKMKDSS